MKNLMAAVFGATVGLIVGLVSSYSLENWQRWVAGLSIVVVGFTYANMPDNDFKSGIWNTLKRFFKDGDWVEP